MQHGQFVFFKQCQSVFASPIRLSHREQNRYLAEKIRFSYTNLFVYDFDIFRTEPFQFGQLVSAYLCVDQDGAVGVLLVYNPAAGAEKTLDPAVRLVAGDTQQKLGALIFGRDGLAQTVEAEARSC